MSYTIGIDLGGTVIKAAALDLAGKTLDNRNYPTGNAADWPVRVRALVAEIEKSQKAPAASIGVATPGVIAGDGLSVAAIAGKNASLASLDGLNWTEFLGRSRPVPVLNDAHAALLGEAWLGAAAGFQHVVLLTLGTGVGGAIMADGRLVRGWRRLAGHLGHTCLNMDGPPSFMKMPGALELEIGDHTVTRRSGGRFKDTRALVEAADDGDEEANAVWLRSVRALACGMASFINALDPEAIIIGGGIAAGAGETLFGPLRAELDRVEFHPDERRVQILPAKLGEWAGAYGAARNALAEAP